MPYSTVRKREREMVNQWCLGMLDQRAKIFFNQENLE